MDCVDVTNTVQSIVYKNLHYGYLRMCVSSRVPKEQRTDVAILARFAGFVAAYSKL